MSETKHTAEPWEMRLSSNPKNGSDWRDIISLGEEKYCPRYVGEVMEKDGRRIVACINACAGIPTEALEKGAVKELLEACKYALGLIPIARKYFPKSVCNSDRFQLENACATLGRAIQKAEDE